MYAFGLEEAGNYELAEAARARRGGGQPRRRVGHHAVVHVYEMRGQVDTGIGFLRRQEGHWTANNLFTVHNWWHLALFLLEAGHPDAALAVYDDADPPRRSAGVPLEMLDASALLVAAPARRCAHR